MNGSGFLGKGKDDGTGTGAILPKKKQVQASGACIPIYHLYFDLAFMTGIYQAITDICMSVEERMRSGHIIYHPGKMDDCVAGNPGCSINHFIKKIQGILKIHFLVQASPLIFAPINDHPTGCKKNKLMEQTTKYRVLWWLVFLASTAALILAICTHWPWLTLILPFFATSFVKAMNIM